MPQGQKYEKTDEGVVGGHLQSISNDVACIVADEILQGSPGGGVGGLIPSRLCGGLFRSQKKTSAARLQQSADEVSKQTDNAENKLGEP